MVGGQRIKLFPDAQAVDGGPKEGSWVFRNSKEEG